MANEDEKKSPDEYQYPDEYYSGDEYKPAGGEEEYSDEETLEDTSPVQTQRRRRIFYILGLIGAIALVYAILTFTTRQRTPDITAQVTPPVQTAPPVPVGAPPPTTPVPVQQPAITTTAVMNNDAQRAMQQQLQTNQQAIATLQNQMQQLQTDLSQLTENLTTMTGQIQIIANEIKALDTQRSLRESKKLLRYSMMKTYYLKALVPGRAWLQSKDGHVETVTLGDRLPGYGIIQTIDTEQGIVSTSSGRLIQYGRRDS